MSGKKNARSFYTVREDWTKPANGLSQLLIFLSPDIANNLAWVFCELFAAVENCTGRRGALAAARACVRCAELAQQLAWGVAAFRRAKAAANGHTEGS